MEEVKYDMNNHELQFAICSAADALKNGHLHKAAVPVLKALLEKLCAVQAMRAAAITLSEPKPKG